MGNLTHCKIFVHVDIRIEWAQQCISNNKYFQHQENQREEILKGKKRIKKIKENVGLTCEQPITITNTIERVTKTRTQYLIYNDIML